MSQKKEPRSDIFWFRPSELIFKDGFNPREKLGNIAGLREEVRALGIKDPLTGYREGKFVVVKSGHRRTIVAKELEAEGVNIRVPVILEKQRYNVQYRDLDLLTDNGGLPFTPWEQAKVIQRLLNYGWTEQVIAERSGKSLVYLRRLQLLLAAPEKAIVLVRKERVSATLVMDLMANGQIEELLLKAEQNELPKAPSEIDMFGLPEPVANPVRITQTDLRPNSWKIFRKWSSKIDIKDLSADKVKIFKWLKRMEEGKLTEDDFKDFFR